jgi:TolB-like protein
MKNKQKTAHVNLRFTWLLWLLAFGISQMGFAQTGNQKKAVIAVTDFDTRSYNINRQELLQYLTNELLRIGNYEVMDRYDIEFLAQKDTLKIEGCFSKLCLSTTGKKLQTDKIFTGSIQELGDQIHVTLRMLDVQTGVFEKNQVTEFLKIPGNEFMMIRVTMNQMFGIPNDENIVRKLTVKADYDNTINNPYELKLRADGPRMGIGFFSGLNASIMKAPAQLGGFDAYPFMFQFGYQFEKQYLNEGNFQALFEFIPNISGMDQGRVIPSFTFLNGLRNNKSGFEFAFGPTLTFTKTAKGFIGPDNKWYLEKDATLFLPDQVNLTQRLDSRGAPTLTTGFLFAVGKTFKSGKMNIPVNAYIVPGKDGMRYGVSFGWNGRDRYELKK